MVSTLRDRLRIVTSLLILAGVLLFPFACTQVDPIQGCNGQDSNCGSAGEFRCINDRCYRTDPCGAGIFRFFGNGAGSEPYVEELATTPLPPEQYTVRQVLTAEQLRQIQKPNYDGEQMQLPADGNRYPMRFEVDFFDSVATKNSEERQRARNGELFGVYAEANIALTTEDALICSAYMYLWATKNIYAKICIGSGQLSLVQGERQFLPISLPDGFDTQQPHTYRLILKPEVNPETGEVDNKVIVTVDGIVLLSEPAAVVSVPTAKPNRVSLYGFGSEAQGGSRWDWVRWGCNPDGGTCLPEVQEDDTNACNDLRNFTPGMCPGGRGVADEICDGLDNDCNQATDDIFLVSSGALFRPYVDRITGERLQLGDACSIGECTNARVTCNPADRTTMICDRETHFAQLLPAGATVVIPDEICDSKDNDCDGLVDEDFGFVVAGQPNSGLRRYVDPTDPPPGTPLSLAEPCGKGACAGARVVCGASGLPVCDRPPGAPEVCGDAIDNDCDGITDEGFDRDGDGALACDCSLLVGGNCDPSVLVDCNDNPNDDGANIRPGADERCNDRDDDCDGLVDEGLDADGDGYWPCQRTGCREVCADGDPDCCLRNSAGRTIDCNDDPDDVTAGDINPGMPESCNNVDDDCDNEVDEGFARDTNPETRAEQRGYDTNAHCGSCGFSCADAPARQGLNYVPVCEQQVGGGFACSTQCVLGFFDADRSSDTGCECTPRVTESCDDFSAAFSYIEGATGCSEVCDGGDNDCDGRIDEGAPVLDAVIDRLRPGAQRADQFQLQMVTRPCFTFGEGLVIDQPTSLCRSGRMTCRNGEQVVAAGQCLGQVGPEPVESCNGIDDDCDGRVDEGVPEVGAFCDVQFEDNSGTKPGICRYGRVACQAGRSVCVQLYQPRVEICNLEDDDCDGRSDEGFDLDQDGFRSCGVCGDTQVPSNPNCSVIADDNLDNNCICVDDCNDTPGVGATINRTRPEVCDGLDNDCNGVVDDPFTGTPNEPGRRNDNGDLIYARDARFCGSCNSDCNRLPNVVDGSGTCRYNGPQDGTGVCGFTCLPNYADQNAAAPGCETTLCTPDTPGFDEIGDSCPKVIVDAGGVPVAQCACQATKLCISVNGTYEVKCVSDPLRGAQEDADTIELLACTNNGAVPSRVTGIRVDGCDGIDNDCDGLIDEDFRNAQGAYNTQEHCGACNQPCRAPNATPVCTGGVCTLNPTLHCDNGFVDLDGLIGNGCEYRCNKVALTDAVCDGVRDANDRILSGDDDCDGRLDEDVRFDTDSNNCGSCGNVCAFSNAFSLCVAGECRIDSAAPNQPPTVGCVNGFADCDRELENGCEVDLRTTFSDCGSCDQACSTLSATQCSGRSCSCGNSGVPCAAVGLSVVCDPNPDSIGGVTRNCVQCLNDTHCIGNPLFNNAAPALRFCQAKQCKECVAGTNEGCGPLTNRPVCDRGDQLCRNCRNNAECQVLSAQTPYCEDGGADLGKCVLCDPETNFGCSGNTPICRRDAGGNYSCNPCQVVAGQPDQCGGGRTCIAASGACSGCNIETNEGCTNPAPICRQIGGGERCEGCVNSAECNQPGQPVRECVNGSCVGCNPVTNAGCGAQEICCNFECVQTNAINGCEVCGVACNDVTSRACENRNCTCTDDGQECGGATPFCDDAERKCVACVTNTDCPTAQRPLCVLSPVGGGVLAKQCQACQPGTNSGCDQNSIRPICDPDTYTCRGCGGDGECDADVRFDPSNRVQCVANGSCQFCDPNDDAGCLPNEASVCIAQAANSYVCRGCLNADECLDNPVGNRCSASRCGQCASSAECKLAGGVPHPAGNVCLAAVGGVRNCGACVNAAACDNHPDGNLCVGGNCDDCSSDAQCALLRPDQPYCVPTVVGGVQIGICKACDPVTDRPCVGALPVCDPATSTCRACTGNGECNNGLLCVSGKCQICNPGDNSGCNAANPVCVPDGSVCRPCVQDAECAGNANGAGAFCFQGQCRGCNPTTDAGCAPLSNTPVCSAANFTCVGCANDGDCTTNAGNGGECVAPACRVCDPANHDGCRANELCCLGGGGVPQCVPTTGADGGRCTACAGGSCNPQVANVCNDRVCGCGNGAACAGGQVCSPAGICVGCLNDGQCPGDQVCNSGTCQTCRLGTHEGCGAQQLCCPSGAGGAPQCVATSGAAGGSCGACGASCDQASTNTCVNRTCVCGNNAQCVGGFQCDDNGNPVTCLECLKNADCPAGRQCVNGSCGACDVADDRGCDQSSTTPFCVTTNGNNTACVSCQDARVATAGKSCAADPDNGAICIASGRCVECNSNANCTDPTKPLCGADNVCRRCNADAECLGLDPDLPLCDAGGGCIGCRNNLDCANPSPVCGVVGGVPDCVACAGAGDCASIAGRPVCIPATGCVQCATGADCALGQACVNNQCAACANDGQCDAGLVCDEGNGRCVECADNTDCGAEELCCPGGNGEPTCVATSLAGQCEACGVACDGARANACSGRVCLCGAADCGDDNFCVGGNTCVACRGNADCDGATPLCDPGTDTCVACLTNADCDGVTPSCSAAGVCVACDDADDGPACTAMGAEVCNPGTGACVECLASADCDANPAAPVCDANACVACTADAQCVGNAAGPNCDEAAGPTQGQCVDCTADVECYSANPNEARCDLTGLLPVCAGCTADAECVARDGVLADGLLVCDAGTCVECLNDGGCGGGTPICDVATNVCEACTADAECAGNPAGEFCDEAAGPTQGQCVACTADSECGVATPICDPVTKVCEACTADAECAGNPAGEFCDEAAGPTQGQCVECTADSECDGVTPVCDASNECVACSVQDPCGAGFTCQGDGSCLAD